MVDMTVLVLLVLVAVGVWSVDDEDADEKI